ncbi:hypothetical protein A2G94_01980 [Francisella endosymbiont of Ornithodoros moubata]|nr:hypothetical protein A2G94_01980 [Francisella endosymbiont of Ornithodoros moubata]
MLKIKLIKNKLYMDIFSEFVEIEKFTPIKICNHSVDLGLFLNSSNSNIGDISIIPSQQKNDI